MQVEDAETQRQQLDAAHHKYEELVTLLLDNSVHISDQIVHSRQNSIREHIVARYSLTTAVEAQVLVVQRLEAICAIFGV